MAWNSVGARSFSLSLSIHILNSILSMSTIQFLQLHRAIYIEIEKVHTYFFLCLLSGGARARHSAGEKMKSLSKLTHIYHKKYETHYLSIIMQCQIAFGISNALCVMFDNSVSMESLLLICGWCVYVYESMWIVHIKCIYTASFRIFQMQSTIHKHCVSQSKLNIANDIKRLFKFKCLFHLAQLSRNADTL